MAKCPPHEWEKVPDTWVLLKVKKDGDNNVVEAGTILPVEVEVCKNCSELRLFSAKLRGSFK